MDTGGLAQMSSSSFNSANGLPMPSGGLASRRGGQNIKPLSFDNRASHDKGAPTPRTSRSHLLAGLRTAPKSATAATFGPNSPTAQQYARNSMATNLQGYGQDGYYNAPKTAFPQFGGNHNSGYSASMMAAKQQYTVDQVLAPPEIAMDDQYQEQMDPNLYAQLVATNMYLAQQQQRLQDQLRSVQAAAQQFQNLNINSPQLTQQQQMALYEQQQQQQQLQQQLSIQAAMNQGQQVYYNPSTGQYYVDNNNNAANVNNGGAVQQPASTSFNGSFHQQAGPRVQVSPPLEAQRGGHRSVSPPEAAPLPPPSANAFRRGHKKSSSLAPVNSLLASTAGDSPKTATFPLTPMGSYGPGQARAGEHPVRQPRGPPSLDELKAKPTAKHEGSKNFAARTRRSAVHNLVRAGLERRKGTGSSNGSMSPVSELAEDSASPITDNESDSGRSGSGSLAGEMECSTPSMSGSVSWGAIGSERPVSRQKSRQKSRQSAGSDGVPAESENSSFANVFKNGNLRTGKDQDGSDAQRKARLVLTSVEKRKAVAA